MRKEYLYKIYDSSGNYLTTWNDVISQPTFEWNINSGLGEMTIRLARLFDSFGEENDVNLNNEVRIFCKDIDAINGTIIYSGYISGYTPVLDDKNQYVDITLLGYTSTLEDDLLRNGNNTTVTYNSYDPIDIVDDILNKYDGKIQPHLLSQTKFPNNDVSSTVDSGDSPAGIINLYLIINGSPSGNNLIPSSSSTILLQKNIWHSFGGKNYLPGISLTPSQVNADNFGVEIQASDGGTSKFFITTNYKFNIPLTARIVGIKVWYKGKVTANDFVLEEVNMDCFQLTVYYYDGEFVLSNTTISYTFNTSTYLQAIKKIRELCPEGYYFYVDANNLLHFKKKSTTAEHILQIGKHLIKVVSEKRLENVKNVVYFIGNGIYKTYTRSGSISSYGRRVHIIQDQRVTQEATANIMATTFLDENEAVEIRTKLRIIDNNAGTVNIGYDIESIRPGDTVQIKGFGTAYTQQLWDATLWDNGQWDNTISYASGTIMQIVSVSYTPDYIDLEVSSKPIPVNNRIEDIYRNLEDYISKDNPSAPTT